MPSIAELLSCHHKFCDELFAQADSDAGAGDFPSAHRKFVRFRQELERHLQAEEGQLFPALEKVIGPADGPTAVMRSEHARMREVVGRTEAAIAAADKRGYQSMVTTLLILVGQHNHKEENVLYPMCDSVLGARYGELTAQIRSELDASHPC